MDGNPLPWRPTAGPSGNVLPSIVKEIGNSHWIDNPCNQSIVEFTRPTNMVNLFSPDAKSWWRASLKLGLQQSGLFLGSFVINRMHTIRLVQ